METQFYGPDGGEPGRASGWKVRLELATAVVTLATALIGLPLFLHNRASSEAQPLPSASATGGTAADGERGANLEPGKSTGVTEDAGPSSAADAVAAQLRLPEEYIGTWRGIGTQGSQKYLTIVRLRGGEAGEEVGDSSYPPLDCTGKLTLISGGDDVVIREEATVGCQDIDLHLSLNADGTLDYVAGEPDSRPWWGS